MKKSLCSVAVLGSLLLTFAAGGSLAADGPVFLRGDANSDGRVSISDAVMLRRYEFNGERPPACLDAGDVDDNGQLDLTDLVRLVSALFLGGIDISAPFPTPGTDPTPDDDTPCDAYQPTPAEATDDLLRIGDVTASPGDEVLIPVYLTNSVAVDAVQLAVKYDPSVFRPASSQVVVLDFSGTPWESSFDGIDDNWFKTLRVYPEEGLFIVGVIAHIIDTGHEIPPGSDTVILRIRGTVSPNAEPGTTVTFEPTNGPDGQGVRPPFNLMNELTHRGDARYVSFFPRLELGRLAIVDDIGFFIRGDANSDQKVDISDAIHVLDFLFLGGPSPRCLDSADADDTGVIDITDAVVVLSTLYAGSASIAPPFPSAGPDSTSDGLVPCQR